MPDAPYAGPFYSANDPQGRGPDKSPYMCGVKRGLSRAGHLVWAQFDDHYNLRTEQGAKRFQRSVGIDGDGTGWGRGSHEALELAKRVGTHEPALDDVAIMLMEDGYDLKHPPVIVTPIEQVRAALVAYLLDCELNKKRIHYLQQRPMTSLGDDPDDGFYGDCSEQEVAACYWVRRATGIHVPDPAGYGYEGYGNSVSLYQTNRDRKIGFYGPFEVGDIALYGPGASRHATMCRKPGNYETAIFTSHGSESGPVPTRVYYRSSTYGGTWGDLFAVVRPRLVP